MDALKELQEEYQDWLDGLPENLESSPVAEKLDVIVELDFDELTSLLEEAEMADLPLGFGRD